MPQPWTTWRPCRCLKPAISARGAAEPPTSMPFIFERSQAPGLRVEHLQDPHPDRRHAGGPGDVVLDEVLEQALRVEMRAGEDELRPEHRREVRVAPRVRVEHRHDRQDRVLLGDAEAHRIAGRDAEAVQDARAVRVEDALRQAGGAARVAHRRGLVLVQLRVAPGGGVGGGEKLLVGVLDDEDVLDRRPLAELVEERDEALVDDHGPVVRVRRDVGEVVRVQAQVQRVQDEAAAGDAEVRLEVLMVVPAERRDAVAALEPELGERDRELLRAPHRLAPGRAVEALVGEPGDDLVGPVVRLDAPQHVRQRELEVHHQAVHHHSSRSRCSRSWHGSPRSGRSPAPQAVTLERRARALRSRPAAPPARRRSRAARAPACSSGGAGAPT